MYEHIDKIKKSKLICYLNHISLFFLLVYAHIIFHFKYNAYKITNSEIFLYYASTCHFEMYNLLSINSPIQYLFNHGNQCSNTLFPVCTPAPARG